MKYGSISQTKSGLFLKLIFIFFLLGTAAKILLVGYDIDEQYAISMSYRLLQGDFPVLDMWEPHQTSAFLISLLMVPYLAITGTVTGIVLYLRVCGLLIHTGLSFLLYRFLTKGPLANCPYLKGKTTSYPFLLACIYFFSLPKLMFLPEFSNMQLWFLLLTILCLMKYYGAADDSAKVDGVVKNSKSFGYLATAGFFMMLEVLTYPSTILAFFAVLIYVIFYGRKKTVLKELIAFVAPCLFGAVLFCGFLLTRMNLGELITNLQIVASDGSHSQPFAEALWTNIISFGEILGYFLLYGGISTLLYLALRKKLRTHDITPLLGFTSILIMVTLIGQLFIWLFGNQYPNYPLVEYFFLPTLCIIMTIQRKKGTNPVFSFFAVIPLVAFLGIVVFTNHPLLVSAPFLILGVIGALTLLGTYAMPKETTYKLLRYALLFWVCILLFGKMYLIRTTSGKHYTVFEEISLIREGPAIGIIADTDTVKKYREAIYLAENYLPSNAKVFYAGRHVGIYLLNDMNYCTPSTISSPTFDEKVTYYFELHPDKAPDYIICDHDIQDLNEDSWLVEYLEQNCSEEPVEMYFHWLYRVD